MRPRVLETWLFLAVMVLYLPSAGFGWVYDDTEVVRMQEPADSLSDVVQIFSEPHGLPLSQLPYYRATTRASLLVQKAVHGDRPGPFHVANAVLAGLAALGVFWLLRAPRVGLAPGYAALGAAAFAVHPVVSSCVYPIASGRETLLPMTCALFAIAAWLRGGVRGRALGTALVGLALLGKEQALVLPLVLLSAEAFAMTPDPPGRSPRAWLLRALPLAGVTVAYLVLRGQVLPPSDVDANPLVFIAQHLLANPLGPLQSLLFAAQSWFLPAGQLAYEPEFAIWFSPLRSLAALALLAVVFVGARRGAGLRQALHWLAFVPLALALTLNLFPQEARFAERFLMLSSLGFAALFAHAVQAAPAGRPAWAARGAAAAFVLLLAGTSMVRGQAFLDELAFAERWVESDPERATARFILGTALARRGETPDALEQLRTAVRLAPELTEAQYNLGVLLANQGRDREAEAAFRQVLRLNPADAEARAALDALTGARTR